MEDADDDGLDDLIDAAVLNVRDPKHSVIARLKSRLPKPAAPVSRETGRVFSQQTGWVLRDQVATLFPSMAAQVDAMAAQVAAITGLDDFAQKQWQQSAQEQARRTGEMWPNADTPISAPGRRIAAMPFPSGVATSSVAIMSAPPIARDDAGGVFRTTTGEIFPAKKYPPFATIDIKNRWRW